MDINELLKGPGLVIKNPEKKRKNDGRPDTIVVPYTDKNSNSIYDAFNKDTDSTGNIFANVKDADKYDRYGITISKSNIDSLDKELADAQSNWAKAFNSVMQIGNEVVLGSAAAITELPTMLAKGSAVIFDQLFKNVFGAYDDDRIQRTLGLDDNDYNNAVSRKINEWKDYFDNEVVPIYTDPNLNIANGGLLNFGWWMSNMPTIASTLTLLAPAKLATFGVGKLANVISKANNTRKIEKAIKAAKSEEAVAAARAMGTGIEEEVKLNGLQRALNNPITRGKLKQAGKTTAEALIMRTAENFQEAHQTYNDAYADAAEKLQNMSNEDYQHVIDNFKKDLDANGINVQDKDAVAKFIARRSADRTFLIDYSNTFFDIWQLGAIRKLGRIGNKITSGSIARENRNFLRQISGAAEPGKFKKLAERTWDGLKGSGNLIFSELSEGVEEAVNYIAQMEGLSYGKALMDGETDATLNGFFNTRIWDYSKNADMWESAFWGVFGGVVFGAGYTGVNNLRSKRRAAKTKKAIADIERETGERPNVEEWLLSGELPEIAKAKAGIARRLVRMQDIKTKMDAIADGKNPYETNNDGTFKKFDGDLEVQQAIARQQIMSDFIADTTIDELTNGTYELFTDALSTKQVRQWFIDNGLVSNEETDGYINNILKEAHDVKNEYNKQLSHVNYQVAALNKKLPMSEAIPLEYVQQIAKNNLMLELKNKTIDKKINALDNIANSITNNLSPEEKVKAQHLIQLQMLQDYYGRLTAKEKQIKEGGGVDSKGRPLSAWRKAETLDDLKQQKEAVLNAIKTSFDVNGQTPTGEQAERALGAMLYTIRSSFGYRADSAGNITFDQTDAKFNATDAEIIKDFEDLFKSSNSSVDTLGQLSKQLNQEMGRLIGKNGLYERNVRLFNIYQDRASLFTERRVNTSLIASTQSSIRNAVDVLHNRNNQLRKEKIALAERTIRELHDKYFDTAEGDIEQIIIDAFFNDRSAAYDLARQKLTGTDADGTKDSQKLIDALNIINFSRGANRSVYTYLREVLQANAEKNRITRKSSSTNQNQSQAQQNPSTNNPSATPQQANRQAVSGQNSNVPPTQPTPQPVQQSTQQPAQSATPSTPPSANPSTPTNNGTLYATISIGQDGNIDKVSVTNRAGANTLPINRVTLQNGKSVFEVDINNLPTGEQMSYFNSNLFNANNVDFLRQDSTIEIVNKPQLIRLPNGTWQLYSAGTLRQTINQPAPTNQPGTNVQQGSQQGAQPAVAPLRTVATSTTQSAMLEEIFGADETFDDEDFDINDLPSIEEEDNKQIFVQNTVNTLVNWRNVAATNLATLESNAREVISKSRLNFTQDEIDTLLPPQITKVINAINKIKGTSSINQQAGAVAFMSKTEDTSVFKDKTSIFSVSMENLLISYAKSQLVPTVTLGGVQTKYLIRAADILYLCNNAFGETSDISIAKSVYTMLVAYLNNNSDKFGVLDMDQLKDGSVLDTFNKSESEKIEEWFGTPEYLDEKAAILSGLDAEQQAAIDSLQPGDKLRLVKVEDPRTGGITFMIQANTNGRQRDIAYIPVPYYSPNTGYSKYNFGINTNVMMDANGNIHSVSKDAIEYMFLSNDSDAVAIRDLLMRAAIDSNYKYRSGNNTTAGYAAQLSRIGYIQQLCNTKLPNGMNLIWHNTGRNRPTIDYDEVLEGLLRLWNYTYLHPTDIAYTTPQQQIQKGIDNWFKKVYTSYFTIYDYAQRDIDEKECEVISINEGTPRFISTPASYNTCKPVNTLPAGTRFRLADMDTNIQKLTVSNPTTVGGTDTEISTNSKARGTNIVIYTRAKKPTIVKAFGFQLNDISASLTTNATNIFKSVRPVIVSSLKRLAANPYDQNARNEFIEVLNSIMATSKTDNTIIPLYRAKSGAFIIQSYKNSKGVNGIEIVYRDADMKYHNLHIYFNGINGDPNIGFFYKNKMNKPVFNTSTTSVENSIATAILTMVTEHGQINVDSNAIKGDNTHAEINRGFVKRIANNGSSQVIIDIPGMQGGPQVYNSFNDYIVSNNFIKVNIEAKNGSLFKRTGNTGTTNVNQQLFISIPTSPVEGSVGDGSVYIDDYVEGTDTNEENKTKVIGTLDSRMSNPMATIFTNIGANNVYDRLLEICNGDRQLVADLFPEHITYNKELNVIYSQNRELKQYGPVANTNPDDTIDRTYRVLRRKYDRYGRPYYRVVTQRSRKGWVVVGNRWLNMISSNNASRRNTAIRTMIHEKFHIQFHKKNVDRRKILDDVASIYDVFYKRFINDYDNTNVAHNYIQSIISRYNNSQNKDTLYEEFLAEAITSPAFYNYLNSIILTDEEKKLLGNITGENKKESLFNRIINAIRELFGWNRIEDNSLYEKVFQTLMDATTTTQEEAVAQVEETLNPDEEVITDVEENVNDNSSDIDLNSILGGISLSFSSIEEDTSEDIFVSAMNTNNIDTLFSKISFENRENLQSMINNGWISVTCN